MDEVIEEDLCGHYEITGEQASQLDREGFLRLPGVLNPATLGTAVSSVHHATTNSPQLTRPRRERSAYEMAFVQEMNLWQRYEEIRPLVYSPKLARIAAELLGVDGVRLYHDQALVKEAHGGKTPWHCDQYYWPLDTDRTLTAWIPLDDVPLEQGPLAFAKGSHRVDVGRELDISEASEQKILAHDAWPEFELDEAPFRAGDISVHLGWTFHGARPNNTDSERSVFTIIYVADGTPLAEPVTQGQRDDREKWLPDSRIGEPIDSWLNPLLWHRDGSHVGAVERAVPIAKRMGTIVLD